MAKKLTNKVTWVGKVDWDLRNFHGNEYSVWKGSSYNSYLIRDKKNVLIDTVWQPYAKEFVRELNREIHLDKLDYIIINHGEIDHSGALPELMQYIPDTPIYCTEKGIQSLKGHYHKDWNFVPVKTGDVLELGDSKLYFVEAPMLHWPDTMFTYMTQENILFSNDAFGQHFATDLLYNDKVDKAELYAEAIKYYANILTPFSPLVSKKIQQVLELNLPVDMICTSHGVIWRENPSQIIEHYLKWADDYHENQITIIYDTMWNGTKTMAESIAKGIRKEDSTVIIKVFNASKQDKNDIITEIFKSKAILVGSPTVNNGYLHSIGGLLEMLKGLKMKQKSAAAFGSYGWSGEAVKLITKDLENCGFTIIDQGHKALWMPDDEERFYCEEYGKSFIEKL